MYITSPDQAGFLLDATEISVDIETNTEAPSKGWKDGYGLSYCTDITWISFYVGGYDPVVFDLRGDPADKEPIIDFIRKVFNRDNYTVIGHNLGFDMRLIGGHLGCKIPLGSRAWDTLTMAILLLMGDDFRGDISLKSMASRYGLFKDLEELEFLERMKSKRDALHLEGAEDVMRYVVADTVITWRLYELQKKIIETSKDPMVEPYAVVRDGEVVIDVAPRGNKPRYLSTKSWSNLPSLVDWETRISRWSCNAAARGIRLDQNAAVTHMTNLAEGYKVALDQVASMVECRFPHEKLFELYTLIYYKQVMKYELGKESKPKPEKWAYAYKELATISDLAHWIESDTIEDSVLIACVLDDPMNVGYTVDFIEQYKDNPPWINLEGWVKNNLFPYPDGVDTTTTELANDRQERAKITVEWFEHYFTRTSIIDPMKLANMKLFQPFFTFVVCNKDFPTNQDIAINTSLVTDKLRAMVEKGVDMDYRDAALTTYGWSFSESALTHYFPKENPDDHDEPVHPFLALLGNKSMMNRSDEFIRHSERDGRIHSIIARKTRTGRATSTTMNLQNIDMKAYRGYLIPDEGDRVLIGIDISNAENWMLAMIFGDSALASACASGDFHAQMAEAYWPDLVKHLLENGRFEEWKALRKKGKFVTFGSAYGAGARKIARMIGTTTEEAQQLLDNRDRRFAAYSSGRKKLSERIEKCYRDGHRPAFAALWSGRRVAIPMRETRRRKVVDGKFIEETRMELAAYKATNYLPQGGVGEIIWRGIVMASEQFEREGLDAHVCLQVHDEIIIDTPIDIAFKVASYVINALADMIPKEFRQRTNPEIRILSQLGPENAKKWGYRYGQAYVLPTDVFVNQWGTFPMPEGENEAPTWIGNLAEGYELQSEIDSHAAEQIPVSDSEEHEATIQIENRWREFPTLVNDIRQALSVVEQYQGVSRLNVDGQDKGLFDFPNRMLIQQELAHKGYQSGEEYWDVLKSIDLLKLSLKQLESWVQ